MNTLNHFFKHNLHEGIKENSGVQEISELVCYIIATTQSELDLRASH